MPDPADMPPYAALLKTGGRSEITPLYFRVEVLARFRQDPNYRVMSHGIWARDDADSADACGVQQYVPARGPKGEPGIMVILAHLATATAAEQRHFEQYQLAGGTLHPEVRRAILHGVPPASVSPLDALCLAQAEVNLLCPSQPLFESHDAWMADATEELGPIAYNSRKEYVNFVKALDALMSESISTPFLDEAGVTDTDDDGNRLGTIARLSIYLQSRGMSASATEQIVGIFQRIRKERQPAAHGIHQDASDTDYRAEQGEVFNEAAESIRALAKWLGQHLHGEDYQMPWTISAPVRSLIPE